MKNISEILTFRVTLGAKAHRQAEQFRLKHGNPKKAKEVYLNTLAVFAVDFYLGCMGFDTDRQASQSWNPLMQSFMDVADLSVTGLGKIECRPVLPDTQLVYIPPEVWSDRIGYVAVKLDSSLREAELLGFIKTAGIEELPISSLRSLEDLLEHLSHIRQAEPIKMPVNLSQWFGNVFEAGWQSLETLLSTNQQTLAPSLRGALRSREASLRSALRSREAALMGAKLVDLGLQLGSQSIALLVALWPEAEQKVGVLMQVHPTGEEITLPPHLRLVMLSESGETLQEVIARSGDNYIQLKRVWGQPGERFSIMVALDDISIKEDFVI